MFLPHTNHMQATERPKMPFLSLVVTLSFDLQGCPSKGPNMSSVWIWHKSVQWFPEIFHTQTKKQTGGAKNRTFCSSLCVIKILTVKNYTEQKTSLQYTLVISKQTHLNRQNWLISQTAGSDLISHLLPILCRIPIEYCDNVMNCKYKTKYSIAETAQSLSIRHYNSQDMELTHKDNKYLHYKMY